MNTGELRRIAYDAPAFEAFYRDNVEAIQRFIARRLDDPYLAADLTADVFVAAIDAATGYDSERGTPRAWLFGIARIVIASESRRSARERRAVKRIEGRRLLDPDDIARAQERIDAGARARALYASVARLPESERAVFELVALDELSLADAAAALAIRPVTARVRLHRARAALRRQLFDDDPTTLAQLLEAAP